MDILSDMIKRNLKWCLIGFDSVQERPFFTGISMYGKPYSGFDTVKVGETSLGYRIHSDDNGYLIRKNLFSFDSLQEAIEGMNRKKLEEIQELEDQIKNIQEKIETLKNTECKVFSYEELVEKAAELERKRILSEFKTKSL